MAKAQECKLHCCTTPPAAVERIRADLAQWGAGSWAQLVNPGPTCSCNVRSSKVPCTLHPEGEADGG